jgi:hypothetical protein
MAKALGTGFAGKPDFSRGLPCRPTSAVKRRHVAARVLHFGQNNVRMVQQLTPRRRDRHHAAHAVEKSAAQISFQSLDRVAHGGLCKPHLFRGLRKAAHAGQSGEGEEFAAIENGGRHGKGDELRGGCHEHDSSHHRRRGLA